MDKKSLSEQDIRTKYITPALTEAGWDTMTQLREEVTFTDGRIIARGRSHRRGKRKSVDYLLYYRANLPLAVVEAKSNAKPEGHGMQQALGYAQALDVPFVYTSNGDSFVEHDRTGQSETIERVLAMDAFPSPEELWSRYRRWKGLSPEQTEVILQDYHAEAGGKTPRYYQRVAINRAVEAVATGQERLLLVMATGTGKTYTAFQIIWRLWKAGRAKRVLFLADRNILVDQAMQNDFRPFGGAMVKIKNRTADPAYEIYLALYQAVSGTEDQQNIYRDFSPDFFDLIVVDECHRGSAAADSAWRDILDYFEPAAQLGLTATPKETTDVSTSHYFGEPLYTYSLKQGIEDGFLAPYRVVRVGLDRDLETWRPEQGQLDRYGRPIEDRAYGSKDFDKTVILTDRDRAVAQRIAEYLEGTDPYAKTIVFCVRIDHAERMRRALTNALADRARENEAYVVRITGDHEEGKRALDDFIDPEARYPVIATTSKLMTTGVDAQTCKLIVLDQVIGSMTEFKQIIGRGTRLREDLGKTSFTIMDFRSNTDKFADPDFDGDPVRVFVIGEDEPLVLPDDDSGDATEGEAEGDDLPGGGAVLSPWDPDAPHPDARPYVVDGVSVRVINERVQYYGPGGKLITERLRDYTRDRVCGQYATLEAFLARWRSAQRKAAVVDELAGRGVLFAELEREVAAMRGAGAEPLDAFDLVAYVAYDRPPLSRSERARKVRQSALFDAYEGTARDVLAALLDKYAEEGIATLEDPHVLELSPFKGMGRPIELARAFGSVNEYTRAVQQLERALYAD